MGVNGSYGSYRSTGRILKFFADVLDNNTEWFHLYEFSDWKWNLGRFEK